MRARGVAEENIPGLDETAHGPRSGHLGIFGTNGHQPRNFSLKCIDDSRTIGRILDELLPGVGPPLTHAFDGLDRLSERKPGTNLIQ